MTRSGAIGTGLMVLLLTGSAAADEQRLRDLEQRQEQMSEEIERLRRELEQRPQAEEVEEVERRQGIVAREVARLREALVLPETKELKSAYGLGPAASKVYGIERGLSIGGYGEANFTSFVSDAAGKSDTFDFLRLVLYAGYKYNDWIVFNSEIEFEHASSGSTVSSGNGSVSVEFATLDFLLDPRLNVRGGMVLVPMGFINEIHEPPFFHGNQRNIVERRIIPTTWRTNGFGLFGELAPGLQYRTYGITSLNAAGFSSGGLRGGRQKGNRERADDWSWVARMDYAPVPELSLGSSLLLGSQGQNQVFAGEEADAFMQMYEAHAQVRARGFEMRALGVIADLDDADSLSRAAGETIAEVMLGYYVELAYDVMPHILPESGHYLAPWFRYSRADTQHSVPNGFAADESNDVDAFEFGLSYKPIPQVVLKLDSRWLDAETGSVADEVRIGGGFVF